LLEGGGHQVFFVGGCVRNALLNTEVGDVDMATNALPGRVLALAQEAGLRAVPTGIAHGTVTVVAGGTAYQITTYRKDLHSDGRHALVRFTDDLALDAARRDFTMNALYATPGGKVVDPLGQGLADLQARRVRFVGEARQRIREDYLRILRYFRFHAIYGDAAKGMDATTLAAIAACGACLGRLSKERIGAEMLKLLGAQEPSAAVRAMEQVGILQQVLPDARAHGLVALIRLEQENALLFDSESRCNPLRRLAVLGGHGAARALRLSSKAAHYVNLCHRAAAQAQSVLELGYRHGLRKGRDMVLVRAALAGQAPPAAWQKELQRGAVARFPVTAADLAPHYQGAALGQQLRAQEQLWIDSGFVLERKDLLPRASRYDD